MKVFGAAAIIIASFLGGFSRLRFERKRISCLHSLIDSLMYLKRELLERQTELWSVFQVLCSEAEDDTVRAFYTQLSARRSALGENSFQQIWRQSADAALQAMGKACRDELCTIGTVLGSSELSSQLGAIERACSHLESYASSLKSELSEKGRLTLALSFSLGAFVVILLL